MVVELFCRVRVILIFCRWGCLVLFSLIYIVIYKLKIWVDILWVLDVFFFWLRLIRMMVWENIGFVVVLYRLGSLIRVGKV